jgi:hypothetical protein
MKKKPLLTALALGALLLASCDAIQDIIKNDPPHNLEFTAAELNADTAKTGAPAGSFSAESNSGSALIYSLVYAAGADYRKFTVEGNTLKLAEDLSEGEYYFRVRVADADDQFVEGDFTLTVGPAPDNPLRNLGFTPVALNAGAAKAGATAGSFSVQGGSGALAYSLVEIAGADYDSFTVEGNALKLTKDLGEGEYIFHARVEDAEGQFVEDSFTLTVGPAADQPPPSDNPDNPVAPGQPDTPAVPGESETPGEPAAPDTPAVPGEPDTPG